LFTLPSEPYALAAHPDGTPVSKEKPAQPGEIVTVYGTGLGPYQGRVFDGFPVPAWLSLPLADPVEVLLGEQVIEPESAAAAVGEIGIAAVRFRVPEDAPAAAELRVRVNGKESNGVVLPVGEKVSSAETSAQP
jgi:uncharacterized protein (TIGR03437 family)